MNRSIAQLVFAQAILLSVNSLIVTSAAIIGGTSLLSETYRSEEVAKAQAFNDFVVFTFAAISSFAAGALLHWLSWQFVYYAALPVICIALITQLWLWICKRPRLTSSGPCG